MITYFQKYPIVIVFTSPVLLHTKSSTLLKRCMFKIVFTITLKMLKMFDSVMYVCRCFHCHVSFRIGISETFIKD